MAAKYIARATSRSISSFADVPNSLPKSFILLSKVVFVLEFCSRCPSGRPETDCSSSDRDIRTAGSDSSSAGLTGSLDASVSSRSSDLSFSADCWVLSRLESRQSLSRLVLCSVFKSSFFDDSSIYLTIENIQPAVIPSAFWLVILARQ